MATVTDAFLHDQLVGRKRRLAAAMGAAAAAGAYQELQGLLAEVDGALARIEAGTYGRCEVCHDPVEADRLACDPLLRYCLDHLTADERRALQHDLDTAARIQAALLPRRDLALDGWDVHYHYQPAGAVSGDVLDLVVAGPAGDLYFVFGDVSGKGVAASILMSHLKAIFRGLITAAPPLGDLMADASRMFCENTLASQFATAVAGRLGRGGEAEVVNAGHPGPLLVAGGGVRELPSTGLPMGLFGSVAYGVERFRLAPGDALVLYTDGLSEATNADGEEYGSERPARLLAGRPAPTAEALTRGLRADLETFRAGAPPADDLTLLAIRRAA
jgi:sigma-B regulation protein RsbU (phosphoserine phosphatase)